MRKMRHVLELETKYSEKITVISSISCGLLQLNHVYFRWIEMVSNFQVITLRKVKQNTRRMIFFCGMRRQTNME